MRYVRMLPVAIRNLVLVVERGVVLSHVYSRPIR
jgi:hypothetical protein